MKRPSLALRVAVALLLATTMVVAHEGHDQAVKGLIYEGNLVTLSEPARKALGIAIGDVERRTVERKVFAPAAVLLHPEAHAFATTQLPGRIEQVLVKPGDRVEQDQPLALVRSLELERLELERTTARFELELASQELERVEDLVRKGIRTQRDLLVARNRRQERSNALLVAGLKLRVLSLDPEQRSASEAGLLPVRSPIAGTIAHAELTPGQIVEPQQHLLEIVNASRVRVRVSVPEAYVSIVKVGQQAACGLAGQQEKLPGVIVARDGRIDPRNLVEHFWVELTPEIPPSPAREGRGGGTASSADANSTVTLHPHPGPPPSRGRGALVPGTAGQVEIAVDRRENVLTVPERAVVRDGMETFVFVQTAPGEYRRVPVVTGLSDQGHVEIVAGLSPNALLVTQGMPQLASRFGSKALRPTPEAIKNTGLHVAQPSRQAIAATIDFDAVLELPTESKSVVAAPLAAKVVKLLVAQPGPVIADQELAEVTSLEFQNLQLELIQAELHRQLQEETLAAYARADQEQKGLIPLQFVQEAENARQIALARSASLRRRLEAIGLRAAEIDRVVSKRAVRDSFQLRSPRTGEVIPVESALGAVVKESSPLFEVQDRSRIWVRGRLYEQDLPRVLPDQPARLRLAAERTYLMNTNVLRIDSLPESGGRSRALWAEVDNRDGRLREGMLGRLTVEVGSPQEALAVPVSAVLREGRSEAVFVRSAAPGSAFTLRNVATGRRNDRFVEVLGGLTADETIAATAVADLRRSYGRLK
jgi:membrane fusion protein (multidrug efflux system)